MLCQYNLRSPYPLLFKRKSLFPRVEPMSSLGTTLATNAVNAHPTMPQTTHQMMALLEACTASGDDEDDDGSDQEEDGDNEDDEDGFEDDEHDEDGFEDSEDDEDGFEDDENDEDGFEDDEDDGDGFEDDEVDEDGFEDDEDDEGGFEDDSTFVRRQVEEPDPGNSGLKHRACLKWECQKQFNHPEVNVITVLSPSYSPMSTTSSIIYYYLRTPMEFIYLPGRKKL